MQSHHRTKAHAQHDRYLLSKTSRHVAIAAFAASPIADSTCRSWSREYSTLRLLPFARLGARGGT